MGSIRKPYSGQSGSLPTLLAIEEIRRRLEFIFPKTFPNRGILVGDMAAKVVFVFLYGGFIEGQGRYLRPAHVYFFTGIQADKTSHEEREDWVNQSMRPGFRPEGKRWYADTSKESIRDDLIRNELLRLGLVHKVPGLPITSSKPTYSLSADFAGLFDPAMSGKQWELEVQKWQQGNLDQETLQRMALRAAGVEHRETDVLVDLPDGTRIRLSSGPSSTLVKGLIENFSLRYLTRPAVLWVSGSDKKLNPHFAEISASIGLRFDVSAELPDVVLADLEPPLKVFFCEVVATDGAVTDGRMNALLSLIASSRIPSTSVRFVSVFEDREADAFRKNFGRLAVGSLVWFRTEPDLLVILRKNGRQGLKSIDVHPGI